LADAASIGWVVRSLPAVDYRRDETEGSQNDTRTPTSLASPAHDSQRDQFRRMTPARVQGHDDNNGGDAQMVETEGAAVHGDVTQHAMSDTTQDTGDFAHQLPCTTSESLPTTQPKSPAMVQP
jgi:hypothetical protein